MLKVEMFKLLAKISPLDNFLPFWSSYHSPFHCIPLMTSSPPFCHGIAIPYSLLAAFESSMQVICIELISLYVQVFIPSVNEPWFISLFNQAMVCFLTPSLLDHIMPASYAFHAFLHTMIMMYCCVLGDSCSYDSRVSQFLKLGVNELCSTVPHSNVKSRVYFRVLSQNSQRGRL